MATQIDNSFRSLSFASAISANTLVRISGDNAGQFGIVSPGPVTAGSNVFATTGGVIVGTLVTSGLTLGTAINSGTTGDIVEYAVKL
jgi:hypothetical protein